MSRGMEFGIAFEHDQWSRAYVSLGTATDIHFLDFFLIFLKEELKNNQEASKTFFDSGA